MASSSAQQHSPNPSVSISGSGSSSSSSSEDELGHPTPINTTKLSPFEVGNKVAVYPSSLQTDKIKIINLVSANINPPKWAEGYNDIVHFLWYHPMRIMLVEKPILVFQDLLCAGQAVRLVQQRRVIKL